jgi:hypothetical protein
MKAPGEWRPFIYCTMSRISSIECAKFTISPSVGQSEGSCMSLFSNMTLCVITRITIALRLKKTCQVGK